MQNTNERLKTFLQRIEDYISLEGVYHDNSNLREEFEKCDGMTMEQLNKLSQQECFDYSFLLCQYADHISREKAKQENVVRWCNDSLFRILAQEIDNDMVAKHEIKAARVFIENAVADKINEWKNHAESRLANLTNREYNIRKKADILIEKGKRK